LDTHLAIATGKTLVYGCQLHLKTPTSLYNYKPVVEKMNIQVTDIPGRTDGNNSKHIRQYANTSTGSFLQAWRIHCRIATR
jgi:hypothetical protein